jgi:hypothetical protein
VLDSAIASLHAHLASSTVAVVPTAEANVLAGAGPAVHALHVEGAEQAHFDGLQPAEKAAYVHQHQVSPGSSQS